MAVIQRIAAEQRENPLTDEPVLTPEALTRQVAESDAELTFATSRSASPIAYAHPDHIAGVCADAKELLGVDADDVVLNLCAPEPHLSGFACKRGGESLGATVLGDHFEQYEQVIEAGLAETVTAMVSVPTLALDLAGAIRERHGDPADHFPDLELAMLGGEIVRPDHRAAVTDAWGVDRIREYYGSSEACLVAAGTDDSRRLVPLLNWFVIELLVDGEIVDIRAVDEPQEGSILITDPGRDAIDLVRFRQGDRVRVHPDDPLPRIEPLGREDNAINLAGALLHPGDLYAAVGATYPEMDACLPYVVEDTRPTRVQVFVVGASADRADEIRARLVDRLPALEHAIAGRADWLTVTPVEERFALPFDEPERVIERQVVFASETSIDRADRR